MSRIEKAMAKAFGPRESTSLGEYGRAAAAAGDCATGPATPRPDLFPDTPLLVCLHDLFSPAAEQYRKLKSAVLEMSKEKGRCPNAIAVTSSVPGEGKSLTAVNLAITLAQDLDHTVLLVDADLRRPALHRYLDVEQGVGLSDVVLGRAGLNEAIVPTPLDKLSLLRAGGEVNHPAELFSSAKMKAVIEEMKHCDRDRFVIFDTPPVIPFAETRSLSRLLDGVILVIMERLVSQAHVREALEALKGCHMLGTVYNAAEANLESGHYSYYHGYHRIPGSRATGNPGSQRGG